MYNVVQRLQTVEMRTYMCMTFAHEIFDQFFHSLAHFSEITSFLNRNNECVFPGNFSTLSASEKVLRGTQLTVSELLKCYNQHYL